MAKCTTVKVLWFGDTGDMCVLDMASQKRIFASLTKNYVVYRKLASYTIFCLYVGERHLLNLV